MLKVHLEANYPPPSLDQNPFGIRISNPNLRSSYIVLISFKGRVKVVYRQPLIERPQLKTRPHFYPPHLGLLNNYKYFFIL